MSGKNGTHARDQHRIPSDPSCAISSPRFANADLTPPPIRRAGIPADTSGALRVLQNLDRPAVKTRPPERQRATRTHHHQQHAEQPHVAPTRLFGGVGSSTCVGRQRCSTCGCWFTYSDRRGWSCITTSSPSQNRSFI